MQRLARSSRLVRRRNDFAAAREVNAFNTEVRQVVEFLVRMQADHEHHRATGSSDVEEIASMAPDVSLVATVSAAQEISSQLAAMPAALAISLRLDRLHRLDRGECAPCLPDIAAGQLRCRGVFVDVAFLVSIHAPARSSARSVGISSPS